MIPLLHAKQLGYRVKHDAIFINENQQKALNKPISFEILRKGVVNVPKYSTFRVRERPVNLGDINNLARKKKIYRIESDIHPENLNISKIESKIEKKLKILNLEEITKEMNSEQKVKHNKIRHRLNEGTIWGKNW